MNLSGLTKLSASDTSEKVGWAASAGFDGTFFEKPPMSASLAGQNG